MTEAELLELIGDPDEVARGIEEFSALVRTFDANRDHFIKKYPDMWVAVSRDGTLAAETQEALLAEMDRRGIPRGDACIEFVATKQRTYVLQA